jgi:hypothetical protein
MTNAALVLQLRTVERRLKEAEERLRFAEMQARMLARAADTEKAEAHAWRERYEAIRQSGRADRAELDILGTDERLAQALANVGVDLACGGCAALFYTGSNWPSDVHTCKRTVAAILANPPVAAPLAVEPPASMVCINCQATLGGAPQWYQVRCEGGGRAYPPPDIRTFWWDTLRANWFPTVFANDVLLLLRARGHVITGDAVDADPTTLTYDNPEAGHASP